MRPAPNLVTPDRASPGSHVSATYLEQSSVAFLFLESSILAVTPGGVDTESIGRDRSPTPRTFDTTSAAVFGYSGWNPGNVR